MTPKEIRYEAKGYKEEAAEILRQMVRDAGYARKHFADLEACDKTNDAHMSIGQDWLAKVEENLPRAEQLAADISAACDAVITATDADIEAVVDAKSQDLEKVFGELDAARETVAAAPLKIANTISRAKRGCPR